MFTRKTWTLSLLWLKGLMGSDSEKEAEDISHKPTIIKEMTKPVQQRNFTQQHAKGTVAVTDLTVSADLQDLDDKIRSMIENTENNASDRVKDGRARICKVCGKEGKLSHIQMHIESHHISGVSHICNICGATARSRAALSKHKRRNHTTN